jgi:hypothetical protein
MSLVDVTQIRPVESVIVYLAADDHAYRHAG